MPSPGKPPATPHRFRTVLLLAAAAVLGSILLLQPYVSSEAETEAESPRSNDGDKEATDVIQCYQNVLNHLPIGPGLASYRGSIGVYAHHWDAQNGLWNEEIRFQPLGQIFTKATITNSRSCVVWEVGAHTTAADSKRFLQDYPQCRAHAFEVIPDYAAQLAEHWKSNPRMTTHAFGLSNVTHTVRIPKSSLQGQSTFVQRESQGSKGTIPVELVSIDEAKAQIPMPTLLHLNCEGCEWDLVPQLIRHPTFLKEIPVLQIGWHNYPFKALGQRVQEYCQIRQDLSQTHILSPGGVPFGWERWVLKTYVSSST